MSEYIEFRKIEEKPKTNVYAVINKSYGNRLGVIKWYSNWRKYCFFPKSETLFETKCMYAIVEFIENLMEERKNK